jgi:hypothetical protein
MTNKKKRAMSAKAIADRGMTNKKKRATSAKATADPCGMTNQER